MPDEKRKILIQLDTDLQPSVFDRVVAIDSGADEVFSYGGVKPETARDLVHGAIFTRGPRDLKRTAIFIGGSDVALADRLLEEVRRNMLPQFGLTVSVLLDANGANTTAAAAVHAARAHLDLTQTKALVLGGTGPVGQRVSLLLGREGAEVRVGSRQLARSEAVCAAIRRRFPQCRLTPVSTAVPADLVDALEGRTLIIGAGAAGVVLLKAEVRRTCPTLLVAIDLNAVPPLGLEGIEANDRGTVRDGVICYGALGVGGAKMKIHRTAVAGLFERNDLVLDAVEVYELGRDLKR